MFVIELIYEVGLDEIDASMGDHVAFLKTQYAAGHFLVSGRKVPRDGGVIIATGETRDEIERIIRSDPFVVRGLADYRIIEFRASQHAEDIQQRVEAAAKGARRLSRR